MLFSTSEQQFTVPLERCQRVNHGLSRHIGKRAHLSLRLVNDDGGTVIATFEAIKLSTLLN